MPSQPSQPSQPTQPSQPSRSTSPSRRPSLSIALLITLIISLLITLIYSLTTTPDLRAQQQPADSPNSPFRLNTVGYLPNATKQASIPFPFDSFSIVNTTTNQTVFTAKPSATKPNPDTNEQLSTADFSPLTTPGTYKLVIEGHGSSDPFTIANNAFNPALKLSIEAMYLWRCGTAVHGTHQGDTFQHAACHLQDALADHAGLAPNTKIDTTGGWHDAGDYNKYVTNAGVTLGVMLLAYQHFPDALATLQLNIPESNNSLPDYLDELKFELDWLLKMQRPDGAVYHKVSTLNFGGFIMPEEEKTPRFLAPISSIATADFAAMTAQASRTFQPHDPQYAEQLLAAATRAYDYLAAHPKPFEADQSKFSTGTYDSSDPDERLWAAAELFETTGQPRYLKDIETRIRTRIQQNNNSSIEDTFDWGNVANLGVITYATSNRTSRDPNLVKRTHDDIIASADRIVAATNNHGYARNMATSYYWGANGSVARKTVILHVANTLKPNPAYPAAIHAAADHLLGRNVFGRSFVTGLGHNPPMNPHSRRSGADNVKNPWPGYLVGGGHPRAVDWFDTEASYETNEIAINWNAALIYNLAALATHPEN